MRRPGHKRSGFALLSNMEVKKRPAVERAAKTLLAFDRALADEVAAQIAVWGKRVAATR